MKIYRVVLSSYLENNKNPIIIRRFVDASSKSEAVTIARDALELDIDVNSTNLQLLECTEVGWY